MVATPSSSSGAGSLFAKILEWMLMPLLIIWPTCMGITYLVAISLANQVSDRVLASEARALAEQIVWSQERKSFALLADLRTILSDDEVASVSFRIDDGRGQFHLGESALPAATTGMEVPSGSASFQSASVKNSRVRIVQLSRNVEGAPVPALLQLAETLDRRDAIAKEIVKGVIVPQLLVIPLSVLLVWLGLKSGMAPLEQLRRRVVARPTHDLSSLPPRDAPAEVAPLIAAFNELLMRIERSNLAQRRFIANAAHQLRTPLAGIRMQTELALRDDSPQQIRDALERIATGSSQSTHLIAQLLALARAEADTGEALPFQMVDLVPLTREAVRDSYTAAAAKKIDLGLEAPEQAIGISGQPALLREMLANLVDNAIRYTPAGGRVTVRVIEGTSPAIEVEDNGIGIPETERALVFERFYRVENNIEPGTGIGLAIVKEIVDRHQATIHVLTPAHGGGTRMRIDFALESPASTAP